MLDKSGSMSGDRWNNVKKALIQFFNSPDAKGIKVALNYFNQGSLCGANDYYTPKVPMALLPGNGNSQITALTNSINATSPGGGTPTKPALDGAISFSVKWKQDHPNDKTIVVLASDGQPAGCSSTLANSAASAKAGFDGNPSVPTYVIGVGPSTSNLNTIAVAGGSTKAYIVNDGNSSAFTEALKAIKLQAVSCEYLVPKPSNGQVFNPDKVNVEYSSGGKTTALGSVADKGTCDPSKGGWYYDNPQDPSKIFLCPSTCTVVQKDTEAKVNVLTGCDTQKD